MEKETNCNRNENRKFEKVRIIKAKEMKMLWLYLMTGGCKNVLRGNAHNTPVK